MIILNHLGLYRIILSKLIDVRMGGNKEEASRIEAIMNYHQTIPMAERTERTKLEFISLLRGDMTLDDYIQIKREQNPRQEELNL